MKQYALSVVIGRFQILHKEHERVIRSAQEQGDETLVIVGSADEPRSTRNPFTFDERVEMLRLIFGDTIKIAYVNDWPYRDNLWHASVRDIIAQHHKKTSEVVIVGCDKDHTTEYLRQFPEFNLSFMTDGGINSTRLRRNLYCNQWMETMQYVDPKITNWLRDWASVDGIATPDMLTLRAKYFNEIQYQEKYGLGPFVAADALVTYYDKILLIKRVDGTYALPGGFMNAGETFEACAKRECLEETTLNLRGIIPQASLLFDNPLRDPRAHIITKVFSYDLTGKFLNLPIVEGKDDAKEALWMDFDEFANQRLNFYADHWHIIDRML